MAASYTRAMRHCFYCGIGTTHDYVRVGDTLDLKWQCLVCLNFSSNGDPPQDVQ